MIRLMTQFLQELTRLPGGNLTRWDPVKEEVENMAVGLYRWELRKNQLGANTSQWHAERTELMRAALTLDNLGEDFSSAEVLRDIRQTITGKILHIKNPKEKTSFIICLKPFASQTRSKQKIF